MVIATSPEQQLSLCPAASRSFYGKDKNCHCAFKDLNSFPTPGSPHPAILGSLLRVCLYSSILRFRDSTFQLKHERSLILLNRWSCQLPFCCTRIYTWMALGSSLLRKGWWGEDNFLASILFANHESTSSTSPVHILNRYFLSLLWGDFYESIANFSLLQQGYT